MDWDKAYRAHQGEVFGYIYRRTSGNTDLARDLTQDVFVRAMRYEAQYRYDDGRGVGPWLMTIARNIVADHYKRSSTHREALVPEFFDEWVEVAPAAEVEVFAALDGTAMRRAVERLIPHQREAVVLQYWGRWSNEQISEHMGLNVGAVKTLTYRARRTLQRRLQAVA